MMRMSYVKQTDAQGDIEDREGSYKKASQSYQIHNIFSNHTIR